MENTKVYSSWAIQQAIRYFSDEEKRLVAESLNLSYTEGIHLIQEIRKKHLELSPW